MLGAILKEKLTSFPRLFLFRMTWFTTEEAEAAHYIITIGSLISQYDVKKHNI